MIKCSNINHLSKNVHFFGFKTIEQTNIEQKNDIVDLDSFADILFLFLSGFFLLHEMISVLSNLYTVEYLLSQYTHIKRYLFMN